MNPERYKRVDRVFQRALSQSPERLESFLKEACAGDEGLRREVESLLEHDRKAGSFINSSVPRSLATDQGEKSLPDFVGRTLLHYRIVEKIGQGGMGVVYRAEDSHLKRSVAIKLLPPERMADPARKKRFIHEARAASTLNHPSIIAVYDISNTDGIDFIAMEYVSGKSLSQLIGEKGLPLRDTLSYAVQIADALKKAHNVGIIHRDLKPSNIMVTEDGFIKILDFGLAKLTHLVQDAVPGTAMSSESLSESGIIVGTVAYMSPEQAKGKAVDARADIFSFGAMLYEMVTGRRAFKGDSNISTLAAVLHKEPEPISRIAAGVPRELQRIIARCLKKDPESRFQHVDDVKVALDEMIQELSDKVGASRLRKRWAWTAAGLMAVVLAVVGITWVAWRQIRPELKQTRLTTTPGENPVGTGQISPDGRLLSYGDLTGVHVEVVESREVHDIPLPPEKISEGGRWHPMGWFPDSTKFVALLGESGGHRSAWVLSALGAPARKLLDDADPQAPSPDGTHILHLGISRLNSAHAGEIWLTDPEGEESRRIMTAPENEWFGWPAWSPTGQRIAYPRYRGSELSIESRDLGGGSPTVILPSTKSRIYHTILWGPDGRLFFTRDDSDQNQVRSSLWAIEVDTLTGVPRGAPDRVHQWEDGFALLMNVTADGKRMAVLRGLYQADVYTGQLEANGQHLKDLQRLTFDEHNDYAAAWTPDSKSVLFFSNRNGQLDIFRQALDQNTAELIVTGPGNKYDPAVSPDGSWILYLQEAPGGITRIMRVAIAGGRPQMVCEGQGIDALDCCWPPGNVCVFGQRSPDAKQYVFVALDPIQGRGRELARVELKQPIPSYHYVPVDLVQPVPPYSWRLSRDGSRLAFSQAEKNERDRRVRVIPLAGGQTFKFTLKGQTWLNAVQWSADGKGIYVGSTPGFGGGLSCVDMEGHGTDVFRQIRLPFYDGIRGVPSPDGRKIAVSGFVFYSNIWMIENF